MGKSCANATTYQSGGKKRRRTHKRTHKRGGMFGSREGPHSINSAHGLNVSQAYRSPSTPTQPSRRLPPPHSGRYAPPNQPSPAPVLLRSRPPLSTPLSTPSPAHVGLSAPTPGDTAQSHFDNMQKTAKGHVAAAAAGLGDQAKKALGWLTGKGGGGGSIVNWGGTPSSVGGARAKKYHHPRKGQRSRTRKGRRDFTTKKSSHVFNRRKHYQRKSRKGVRRRPYHKSHRHPRKGQRSRTRKGRRDFTTKKSSHVFNRRRHYQRKSRKGVRRRPYRKHILRGGYQIAGSNVPTSHGYALGITLPYDDSAFASPPPVTATTDCGYIRR